MIKRAVFCFLFMSTMSAAQVRLDAQIASLSRQIEEVEKQILFLLEEQKHNAQLLLEQAAILRALNTRIQELEHEVSELEGFRTIARLRLNVLEEYNSNLLRRVAALEASQQRGNASSPREEPETLRNMLGPNAVIHTNPGYERSRRGRNSGNRPWPDPQESHSPSPVIAFGFENPTFDPHFRPDDVRNGSGVGVSREERNLHMLQGIG